MYILGEFGLLDFTMLRPFPLDARFEAYEPLIYLIFQFFSSRGKPRITKTADTESAVAGARLYIIAETTSTEAELIQLKFNYYIVNNYQ
jgi:hypothetical protein